MLRLLFYLICCLAVCVNGQSPCLNGGLRVNNVCICLPGFVGTNCQIQIITSTTTGSPSTRPISSSPKSSSITALPTTISHSNSEITIDMIINSILNGIIEGFINYISYYLNLQGLGDPNLLSAQDIEILADVFVSTLINETEVLLAGWNAKIPFNQGPDLTLQAKISRLTGNLLYILELDMKKMLNESNPTESIKTIFQNLITSVLVNIEKKFNLEQLQPFNNMIAFAIIGLFDDANLENILVNITNTINTFIQNIFDAFSSESQKAVANRASKLTNPIKKRETHKQVSNIASYKFLNKVFINMLSSKLNDLD